MHQKNLKSASRKNRNWPIVIIAFRRTGPVRPSPSLIRLRRLTVRALISGSEPLLSDPQTRGNIHCGPVYEVLGGHESSKIVR